MSKVILFQGDSITDAGRDYGGGHLGFGYPRLVEAQLGYENPEKYTFINKGISGNRIVDVYARIKADIINLKPDYMSILIGVNDVWHEIENANGVDSEKFKKVYRMLIEEIKTALPNIKIMILEPFVLEAPATQNTEDKPDKWKTFKNEVALRAKAAKEIAEEFSLTFIPLQDEFDKAAENTENNYWLGDGVHPTAMGHELIKREWLKAFNTL